ARPWHASRRGSMTGVEIVFVVIVPIRQLATQIALLVTQLDALPRGQTPACGIALGLEAASVQVHIGELVVIAAEDREIAEVVFDIRLGLTHLTLLVAVNCQKLQRRLRQWTGRTRFVRGYFLFGPVRAESAPERAFASCATIGLANAVSRTISDGVT